VPNDRSKRHGQPPSWLSEKNDEQSGKPPHRKILRPASRRAMGLLPLKQLLFAGGKRHNGEAFLGKMGKMQIRCHV
jgi:hypothetical protein